MEGGAASHATSRATTVLSSGMVLRRLGEYSAANRVTATNFPAQKTSFDKRMETLAMRTFSLTSDSLHVGALVLIHLSEVPYDPPTFIAADASTIKVEDAMPYFNNGVYVIAAIAAFEKLDAANQLVLTCTLYNAQDFADEGSSSISARHHFPSDRPFDFKINLDDVGRLLFVLPRQTGSFSLRAKPVAAEPVLPAAAPSGQLDQFTSALSIVATSEGKRKERKLLLDQALIRDPSVFGGVHQETGPLTLAAREALGRAYPSLTLTDEQLLALITFKLVLTDSLKSGEAKTILIRDLFAGLFPNSSAPPSSDLDALSAVVPALSLVWHTSICSELNNISSRLCALMHTMATREGDKNMILAKLWDRFSCAVSAVTPVTTLDEFVLTFAHNEARMQQLVSLNATIRANSVVFGGGGGGGNGGGGNGRGGGGGDKKLEKRGGGNELSKYCVYALDKSHKDCPQGKECKRIWQNVPFSKLDPEAVRTRVEGIRSHFTSLSKRKTEKGDKDEKQKLKKLKKQEEED
jgi:hypothetical protein